MAPQRSRDATYTLSLRQGPRTQYIPLLGLPANGSGQCAAGPPREKSKPTAFESKAAARASRPMLPSMENLLRVVCRTLL
jgi:hypothetical protein